MNVLHMPFHCSNAASKHRSGSVSSTSSDVRTMNPTDKFLNPRRAPAPKLPRLQTSPPLKQLGGSAEPSPTGSLPSSALSLSSYRGGSQPNSATIPRQFRLPRKPSVEGKSRSLSPPKPSGLRAAFKQFTSPISAKSLPLESERGRQQRLPKGPPEFPYPPTLSRTSSGRISKPSSRPPSRGNGRTQFPHGSAAELPAEPVMQRPLLLRRASDEPQNSDEILHSTSFQSHRRARSSSREPSPLRNSLVFKDGEINSSGIDHKAAPSTHPLETLVEAPSQQTTPIWPVTAFKIPVEDQPHTAIHDPKEKRLPTLPNSPSSAYDASLSETSPAKSLSHNMDKLESHFSNWTMSTESEASPKHQNHSHFSECTYISTSYSPSSTVNSTFSTYGSLAESDDGSSPKLNSRPLASHSPTLSTEYESFSGMCENKVPSDLCYSSISTVESSAVSSPVLANAGLGLGFSSANGHQEKRYGGQFGHFPGYRLPEDLHSSDITLKHYPPFPPSKTRLEQVAVRRQDSVSLPVEVKGLQHSSSMQELMEELSYLGNMIQN